MLNKNFKALPKLMCCMCPNQNYKLNELGINFKLAIYTNILAIIDFVMKLSWLFEPTTRRCHS
jgi:hypothetical protein